MLPHLRLNRGESVETLIRILGAGAQPPPNDLHRPQDGFLSRKGPSFRGQSFAPM